jgi:predicted MPP superfamily phosphohydrolase
MRARPSFFLFILVLYGASGLVQWAMWRWMKRVAPEWVERHRRLLLGILGGLFLLPLTRELSFVLRFQFRWPVLGAIGMIWHITVWMGMAVIGIAEGARRILRLRGRRAAARVAGSNEDAPPASPDRRLALERIGGTLAFATSGSVLAWGTLRGRFEWEVQEVPIRLARLPKALDGFTIVQISDLHVGTFIAERELAKGLGLVRGIRPDLVVITGDIVDADTAYIPLAAQQLGSLRAREGVVCIPGNHDYYTGAGQVLEGMQQAGIDVMLNRGKVIAPRDGGFALLGVDDLWARDTRRGPGPDLALARSMVPQDLATILLAHQPRFAEHAAKAGIDLQLSGHTHGGQINPGIRPIDLFYRYVSGRYDVGSMQLYVNRGFGTVGPPTRVGAPPEITKIVLVAG